MLRPQFTQTLVKTLEKQSVNVHGEAGQGQDRLVTDIAELMQQGGWLVLTLDMKSWAQDYQGMVNSLSVQVRRQLPAVAQPLQDMAEVVKALDEHAAQTGVLLALEHFDALLDNALHLDKNYSNFFSHLNSFRNEDNRALLGITAEPYGTYRFYGEDDIRNISPLDLTCFELRKLSYEEIKAEIQKCAPQLDESTLGQLKLAVYQHPCSFEFLEHCLIQISLGYDREKSFAKRLKLWKSSFERDHKKGVRRKLEGLGNLISITGRETENFSRRLNVLLVSMLGLITTVTVFFDKIKSMLGF